MGRWHIRITWFLFAVFTLSAGNNSDEKVAGTELAQEVDDRLLIFATLDGNLVAIEQQSGEVRWKIKDKPIVQVPVDTTNAIIPIFLPDPRDGSLYSLGNNKEPLKKLPFTIPQLVASSPCRSSDGILYTGKKKDTWFKLDPLTGNKEQVLGWDSSASTCPVEFRGSIFIGRTKYDIMMVDSHNAQRKWNVTFYDYTARSMDKEEISSYDLVHFASSSSGRLVTLGRRRGNLLWDTDLGSPVVAAYILDSDGLLIVPFSILANHTLNYLTAELFTHDEHAAQPHKMNLYPTLYIGDHRYGLYALPSLVDQNLMTISASDNGPLLLRGPHSPDLPKPYPEYPLPGYNYRIPSNFYGKDSTTFQSVPNLGDHVIIYIGHYNMPKYTDTKFLLPDSPRSKQVKLITDASEPLEITARSIGVQTIDSPDLDKLPNNLVKDNHLNLTDGMVKHMYKNAKLWMNQQENKGLKLMLIILVGCVIAMFWYLQVQVREFQNLSQNGSRSGQGSQSRNSNVTAYTEELPDGLVRIGKITFHPEQLLGKGCEGTFVYRGEFDSRKVAVKRLLPECFTFADREVALLRESDAHPNVIRYYCMEQDRLFRYIALELCQATVTDYVQGRCDRNLITALDILKQATSGLAHLHSLGIVHRDIKPHNVLLSMPNNQGQVKAMISDFGLCKKLQVGKVSFSRRSGVTGTYGWIAPEMLSGTERTTYAVDLFSLGCLYYHVLSNGAHPFGDALRRQANILNGEWDMSDLNDSEWETYLQKPLLAAMISANPEDRPCCDAILKHPMFWNSAKILAFFQDVSDRVEKANTDDQVLQSLERESSIIVKADWRIHIHEEVAKDLRKYRTYRGQSVRDLLRALRNKKHHFRELTKEAQDHLGENPDSFTSYWTSRFPLLLVHSWIAMQCVAEEVAFQPYYHTTYRYALSDFKNFVQQYAMDNAELFKKYKLDCSRYEEEFSKALKKVQKKGQYDDDVGEFTNTNRRKTGFYDKTASPGGTRRQNVGLYRNLAADGADPSDTNFIFSDNKNGKSPLHRQAGSRKRKSATKKDEPLVWAIQDPK